MKAITVNACDLFKGEALAGMTYEEWSKANDITRLRKRLEFILSRSQALASTPYSENDKIPANVTGLAQRLARQASQALLFIEDGNPFPAISLALDAGKQIGEINNILVVWDQIQIQVTSRSHSSSGGKKSSRKNVDAEKVARFLLKSEKKFSKAWAMIPNNDGPPLQIDEDTQCYRCIDKDTLIIFDPITEKDRGNDISKRTFQENYFNKAKTPM